MEILLTVENERGILGLTQNHCVSEFRFPATSIKLEVVVIAGVVLGVIIGTSFIYDLFYGRIPNVCIIIGFIYWFPYIVLTRATSEVVWALLSVLVVGTILMGVYLIGGIGAGDVKLICLISGFLEPIEGLKLLFLIFIVGAFWGVVKILFSYVVALSGGDMHKGRTVIRFSGPILTGYLLMLLSRGGI